MVDVAQAGYRTWALSFLFDHSGDDTPWQVLDRYTCDLAFAPSVSGTRAFRPSPPGGPSFPRSLWITQPALSSSSWVRSRFEQAIEIQSQYAKKAYRLCAGGAASLRQGRRTPAPESHRPRR